MHVPRYSNDPKVLEHNYLFKTLYSPDYIGVDNETVGYFNSDII